MGKGIVKNLLKKGFPVAVYAHRDGLNLEDLQKGGAIITKTLRDLGASSDRVLLCVPSSKEVEAAILGTEGLF